MIHTFIPAVGYTRGCGLQAEVAALVAEGRTGNVLLLLEHPPVLTLGATRIGRTFCV